MKTKAAKISRRRVLELMGGGATCALLPACAPDEETAEMAGITAPDPYAGLMEVAAAIKSGETSSLVLTQAMLDRISALDGTYKSYATVMADQALADAQRATEDIAAGRDLGPLHGVPVAVKDLCYTKGVRTMGALAVRRDFVPDFDATVVARLRAAGAVLLGKLNLTEGAMGGYHRDFDVPVNPWNADLWPGVSSSGSGVATAAGLCYAALGTDTGGSIRFPAMANGIVGLKPTYGLVSRYGVMDLAETLDHVGALTRRVADSAAVLQAIAGPDSNDPTTLTAPMPDLLGGIDDGVKGARIGYDRAYTHSAGDAELIAAIESALEILAGLGAEIVEVQVPESIYGMVETWFPLCAYEALKVHAETYPSRAADYGGYFADFLALGTGVSDENYAALTEVRKAFTADFRAVLSKVDALAAAGGGTPLVMPTEANYGNMASFAEYMPKLQVQFTVPADLAGTPTLSMPCGVSPLGPAYTIQFMGDRGAEATLCRIGQAYESATDWHTRRPAV